MHKRTCERKIRMYTRIYIESNYINLIFDSNGVYEEMKDVTHRMN